VNLGLTKEELVHIRAALQFLHHRVGTWAALGKALHLGEGTISNMANGHKRVSEAVVFRAARFAGVSVDDVLTGRFPEPGTCPHCGRGPE